MSCPVVKGDSWETLFFLPLNIFEGGHSTSLEVEVEIVSDAALKLRYQKLTVTRIDV